MHLVYLCNKHVLSTLQLQAQSTTSIIYHVGCCGIKCVNLCNMPGIMSDTKHSFKECEDSHLVCFFLILSVTTEKIIITGTIIWWLRSLTTMEKEGQKVLIKGSTIYAWPLGQIVLIISFWPGCSLPQMSKSIVKKLEWSFLCDFSWKSILNVSSEGNRKMLWYSNSQQMSESCSLCQILWFLVHLQLPCGVPKPQRQLSNFNMTLTPFQDWPMVDLFMRIDIKKYPEFLHCAWQPTRLWKWTMIWGCSQQDKLLHIFWLGRRI